MGPVVAVAPGLGPAHGAHGPRQGSGGAPVAQPAAPLGGGWARTGSTEI